jgi:hypothetical protein
MSPKKAVLFLCLSSGLLLVCAQQTFAFSTNIVISQIYGGGGNTGSVYQNDFIELFNRGSNTVRVDGWSVQYATALGLFSQMTPLAGSIFPGQYYLIQEATGGTTTGALPTPDCIGNINLSSSAGKVCLMLTTNLVTECPTSDTNCVDLIGYGNVNCSETIPATGPSSNDKAVVRFNSCIDTDSNLQDCTVAGAAPRNSSTRFNSCQPYAPFFTSAARTNNVVTLQLSASSPPSIDGSTNLTNWTTLGTATSPTGTFYYFSDTNSFTNRFYRCKN